MEGEKRELKDEQTGKTKKGMGLRRQSSAGSRPEVHRPHRWRTLDINQTSGVENTWK